MRRATRFGWAVAVGLAAGTANAQTTATTTGTTTTGTTGGGGGTVPGSTNASQLGNPIDQSGLSQTPTISAFSNQNQTIPPSISPSNVLGYFYANPYYQGRAGSLPSDNPGGFGAPLYTTNGTTAAAGSVTTGANRNVGTTGSTNTRTGTTTGAITALGNTGLTSNAAGMGGIGGIGGRAGGIGGAGTLGGGGLLGGNANAASNPVGGVVIPPPRAMAYVAVMKFPVAVAPPAMVQANLQSVLDRSTQIVSPRGVQVMAEVGGVVVLRGVVKSEDEARLAEGMVRLTPGIRDVRNELTFPKPADDTP